MFSLRAAAARFQDDYFYPWNSDTETFDTDEESLIIGRLFTVDRFTTIYHRPTRRRQMTFPPGFEVPASGLLQHSTTGEIYIISRTLREETQHSDVYDLVVAGHLAMPPSGGPAVLFRPEVWGGEDDPGPAGLTRIGGTYADIELRTTQAEQGAVEEDSGQVLITMPYSLIMRDNDWVVLNDTYYKVTEPYIDGGFQLARASKVPYDLVVITYYFDTAAGGVYNPSTGVFTPITTDPRLISAIVRLETGIASGSADLETKKGEVYLDESLVTWEPKVGDSVEISSIRYKIMSVLKTKNSTQWKLMIQQWQGFEAPELGS